MNDKLKEFLSVGACIGLLIGIGCYTGFFNNYDLGDLQKILNNASSDLSNIKGNFVLNNANSINKNNKNTSRIGTYRANNIPAEVTRGAELSGYWGNIFKADKKVIFYVYDDRGNNVGYAGDFHDKVSEYYNKNKLNAYYNFEPAQFDYYKNYYVGITGPSKICNSIQECNTMREMSTTRSAMQLFLDRCGKFMCIINPKKNEYIMLRNRNSNEAVNLLMTAKNW